MNDWKSLPDSEGDWLWVYIWGCGCCVHKSGIVWVFEDEIDDMTNITTLQNGLHLSWEGEGHSIDNIKHWMKIELPIVEKDKNE